MTISEPIRTTWDEVLLREQLKQWAERHNRIAAKRIADEIAPRELERVQRDAYLEALIKLMKGGP